MVSHSVFVLLIALLFCLSTATKPIVSCPDECLAPGQAKKQCRNAPACELTTCLRPRGKKGKGVPGLSCSGGAPPKPDPKPDPIPDPPTPSGCPEKCVDPKWANVKCDGLGGCKVVECTRLVKGKRERPGAKCTAINLPACPNKCIDPKWAAEKCKSFPHCKVVVCTRLVRGKIERPGAKCA